MYSSFLRFGRPVETFCIFPAVSSNGLNIHILHFRERMKYDKHTSFSLLDQNYLLVYAHERATLSRYSSRKRHAYLRKPHRKLICSKSQSGFLTLTSLALLGCRGELEVTLTLCKYLPDRVVPQNEWSVECREEWRKSLRMMSLIGAGS